MMGRIIDGPTAAQLRASLERALDARDSQDQGELLLEHQRAVLAAITAGVRTQRTSTVAPSTVPNDWRQDRAACRRQYES